MKKADLKKLSAELKRRNIKLFVEGEYLCAVGQRMDLYSMVSKLSDNARQIADTITSSAPERGGSGLSVIGKDHIYITIK
jgi:hypothetical protein